MNFTRHCLDHVASHWTSVTTSWLQHVQRHQSSVASSPAQALCPHLVPISKRCSKKKKKTPERRVVGPRGAAFRPPKPSERKRTFPPLSAVHSEAPKVHSLESAASSRGSTFLAKFATSWPQQSTATAGRSRRERPRSPERLEPEAEWRPRGRGVRGHRRWCRGRGLVPREAPTKRPGERKVPEHRVESPCKLLEWCEVRWRSVEGG